MGQVMDAESEENAAKHLVDYMGRITAWEARSDEDIAPAPGSALANDDRDTAYDPISFQIAHFRLNAIEHLGTIRTFFELTGGAVAVFSLYTLARASIEACALGIWILKGGTHAKRVKRSLIYVYAGERDVATLSRASGKDRDSEKVYARLEELKARVGSIRQSSISDIPSTTDILKEVDLSLSGLHMSGLAAWRICSGIAHANRHVAAATHEMRLLHDIDGKSGRFLMTSSITLMASVIGTALAYLDELQRLADRLSAA